MKAIEQLENDINQIEQEMSSLVNRIVELEEQIAKKNDHINNLRKTIADLHALLVATK